MSSLPSKDLRKRASTAAIQENTLPRKWHKDNDVPLAVSAKDVKPHYVKRKVRQRVRSYCCHCDEETGRSGVDKKAGAYGTESVDICSTCQHPRCQYCLWKTISRASKSSAEPIGWLSEHDTFIRSSAKANEDAKSIQQLIETEFLSLQGKTDEMWIRERMS